ncbi:MAG: pirin family protein [Methylococcus sp.]|nr:pirin family protein [Methylococcus sp.]
MSTSTHPVTPDTVRHPRTVESLIEGQATSDGAGVKLTRLVDQTLHQRLDPFLLLDAFKSDSPGDYIAGFPDHPHRGFETVTYLIAGRMRHRDNAGHEGLLQSGGVQWMTAGRGIVHSEMPEQEDGLLEGFQLWLNLPASDKMAAPWYRDIPSEDIPEFVTAEGVRVLVIAGTSHGVEGAVQRPLTEPLYLDLYLPAGSRYDQTLPPAAHSFLYVYRGQVKLGERIVPEGKLAILADTGETDGVVLSSKHGSRTLLIAGQPLREPIVQHGPFVMNTKEEIAQAVRDFNAGRFAPQS